ncbi:MAG: tetratricopeptide repeat protein [Gemmatales bacterium]|nr:tetratricopeptide repeat protein [Gemmatales bacterium]
MKKEVLRESGEQKREPAVEVRQAVGPVQVSGESTLAELSPSASLASRAWYHRWQIPVFLTGLLTLALTLWYQPWRMWGRAANWASLAEQALALEEKGNYAQARHLADAILAHESPERWRAVAALVRAGALLTELDNAWLAKVDWLTVLAMPELSLPDINLPRELLQQIGQALRLADPETLPPELRSRWAYRKLWWQVLETDAPADWPQRIEQLLQENPLERPRAYERLVRWRIYRLAKEPQRPSSELDGDWEAALQASARLLVQPFIPNESVARIRHALLLIRRQRLAEARETVSRLAARDPHYSDSLYVLGLAWFIEQRYEEAAQAWQRLIATAPADWVRMPQVLYWLGICHLREKHNADEAERLWLQLLERYPQASRERQAALIMLATLPNYTNQESKVLTMLREALHLQTVENPYLSRGEIETTLETIWQRWMEQEQFPGAQQLARLWLATAGKEAVSGKRWLALALAREADRLWQRQVEGEELSDQETTALRAAYREAGQLLEEVLNQYSTELSQADGANTSQSTRIHFLHQAALCYQRAQEIPRAIRLLEQGLAELDKLAATLRQNSELDAKRQDMLVQLGECWHQLKLPQKALEVLQRAVLVPGPHRVRAYYQLALVLMDAGKLEEAERAIREILIIPVSAQEPPEYRKAMSALGHLHFQREQYESAADYLDKAIARYPQDATPTYSLRFWLAECYRLAGKQEDRKAVGADTETRRQFHRQQKRQHLQRAAKEFDTLNQALLARQKKQPLLGELVVLLRESRFALADCYFHLGEYEKSAQIYEALGHEYERQLAGLRAWFEARRSYLAAGRSEDALRAIDQASRVLQHLREEDLAPTRMTRQQWIQFLEEARQNVRLPDLMP